MSVLLEAITVVVRNDAVDRCVPRGVSALAETAPNVTFRTDGNLSAVGFMTPADVEVYVLTLQKAGLRFVEQGRCRDFAIIDQILGPTVTCEWIELGVEPDGTKFVWLRDTAPGAMVAFKSWKRGADLTLRTDTGVDQLDLDPETGLQFYVDESGIKRYLGEAFRDGQAGGMGRALEERMVRTGEDAILEALQPSANVGVIQEPAVVGNRRDDHRHPIMDGPHEIVGGTGDDGEGADPLVRAGPSPVLPDASQRKGFAALLPNGIRSFWLHTPDRFPFKEAIDGDKASAAFVGIAESGKRSDGFGLSVDRFSPPSG